MRLKELRLKNKLTQQQLADELFLTQHGYSSYELQRTEPNIETLCKIADYYHVTLDYLVGRDFVLDIGYISEEQKKIIKLMQQLEDKELQPITALLEKMISNK